MKTVYYFLAIPLVAYVAKWILFWPAGWTNHLQVDILAPVDFSFEYFTEHGEELEQKYYHLNENDQTKILLDEWVSPSHRVNKRSLVKSGGGLWFIPSFFKPDPNWMRESHTYTDQRLVEIRLSAENLGMVVKFSMYADEHNKELTHFTVDVTARTVFTYKIIIWYTGFQERAQLGMMRGVKTDVEAAYTRDQGRN